MSEWISVEDRKPQSTGSYSVQSDTQGQSGTAQWNGYSWGLICMNKGSLMHHETHEITHWKPLPSPTSDKE